MTLAVSLPRRKPHPTRSGRDPTIARKRHEFTEARPFGLDAGAASLSRDTRDSRSLDAGVCFGNALADSKRRRGLGNSIGGCDPLGGNGSSGGAISFHVFCSDTFGTASATGSAGIGHAGASATAATFDPFSGFASEPGASGLYSDTVIFHASDPIGFPGGIAVSLNLEFAGTLTSTLEAGAVVGVLVQINGVTVANLHDTTDNGTDTSCNSSFLGGEGCANPATDGKVTSQDTDGVPLDTPVTFLFSVEVSAGSSGAASASAVYGDSLDLPIGIDVFNLPEGVTANAPDSNIVNNRFVLPTTSVPEPSTWAMMLLGFASLGFAGYRRARAGRTKLGA